MLKRKKTSDKLSVNNKKCLLGQHSSKHPLLRLNSALMKTKIGSIFYLLKIIQVEAEMFSFKFFISKAQFHHFLQLIKWKGCFFSSSSKLSRPLLHTCNLLNPNSFIVRVLQLLTAQELFVVSLYSSTQTSARMSALRKPFSSY